MASGRLCFSVQANGSLIKKDGTYTTDDTQAVGSALIGQNFSSHAILPSSSQAAAKRNGYDATSSGGSNLGPLSDKLINGVTATQPATAPATAPATQDAASQSTTATTPSTASQPLPRHSSATQAVTQTLAFRWCTTTRHSLRHGQWHFVQTLHCQIRRPRQRLFKVGSSALPNFRTRMAT